MTAPMAEYGTTLGPQIQGVVTARKCGHREHHEIGVTTEDGRFIPRRPGRIVEIKGQKQYPKLREDPT